MNRCHISYNIVVALALTLVSIFFFDQPITAIARVGVNDPWCSDVPGPIVVAAAAMLAFIWLFRMKPAHPGAMAVTPFH